MDSEEPNQGKRTIAALGVLLMLTLFMSATGCGYVKKTRSQSQAQKVTSVLHLETFTVNLSDPEQKAYLRLGVDLELERAEKAGKEEMPVGLVRDTILTVLMATTPAELATPEGKQILKEKLLQSLQKRAPGLGVREVYFTEFLMQQ
jgi:flagellar basal body-associated protein FliL